MILGHIFNGLRMRRHLLLNVKSFINSNADILLINQTVRILTVNSVARPVFPVVMVPTRREVPDCRIAQSFDRPSTTLLQTILQS